MNINRGHFNILLQLGYDYISFLELFEDEESVSRREQVETILTRIEKNYGLSPFTETEPQQESTKTEGPWELLPIRYHPNT